MCTVTAVRAPSGAISLVFSRDEQRTRAVSLPPSEHAVGERRVIMPTDPDSGGTWIGVSDAGLCACLLNGNPPLRSPDWSSRRSRGRVVPALLAAGSLADARRLACSLQARDFPPFRLLVLSAGGEAFVGTSDATRLELSTPTTLSGPLMFTSSGLGDHVVCAPRRADFDGVFGAEPDPLAAQKRLHAMACDVHPELAVLMSRDDARTVSRTEVVLEPSRVTLRHVRLDDRLRDEPSPTTLGLEIVHPARAVPA